MTKKKSTDPSAEFVGDARIKEAFRRILADEPFDGLDLSGSKDMTIGIHPIAAETPPMSYEEFTRLGLRVEQYGFRHPVILTGDRQQVLLGRHRVAIAWVLGIPLRKVNFFAPAGKSDQTKVDQRWTLGYLPLDWADSAVRELSVDDNDIRRHYTTALTALVACNRYLDEARAGAKQRQEEGSAPIGAKGGKAAEEVARLSGLSTRTIERIMIVTPTETPHTYERVWLRQITSVQAAYNAAKEEIAEQEAAAKAAAKQAEREAATSPAERAAAAPRSSAVGKSLDKVIELLHKDLEELRRGMRPMLSADEQRDRLIEITAAVEEWFNILDHDDDTTRTDPPRGEAF
jgi:hypothetical protein